MAQHVIACPLPYSSSPHLHPHLQVVRANAVYEGRYLLGTSIARPCIGKRQIEICRREGAEYVSHGSTGKGNDQVRFELCYLAMAPDVECVTLWRDRAYLDKFQGRLDLIDYAEEQNIPVGATKEHSYVCINLCVVYVYVSKVLLEHPLGLVRTFPSAPPSSTCTSLQGEA